MKHIRLLAVQLVYSPRVLWFLVVLALLALALAAGAPDTGSCGASSC